MRQIFRYKGKHILYNTWQVEETEEEKAEAEKQAAAEGEKEEIGEKENEAETRAKARAEEAQLSAEQMNVVLASMSDNRINDSVKSLVEQNS